MINTVGELLARIRLGEDSTIELKEMRFAGNRVSGPGRDDLADELAAFANSQGGVCLLGITDKDHAVVGIPWARLDVAEAFIRDACQYSVTPPLAPFTEKLTLPNAVGESVPVLKVEIRRSLFVHKSPGGYFHRVGSSKRQMAPDHLARLFQQRSQTRLIRFDEQIISTATTSELDRPLWERFRTSRSQDDDTAFLIKLAMVRVDEDSTPRPTVSGVLMASQDPRVWLPNAFIQAVAYRGRELTEATGSAPYQLDAKDITGPLDRQVSEACRFVLRNMRQSATKRVGREDRPQFDLTAVFEAVVNAVAHRDYSIAGSKTRLRLFSDRLELSSPGSLTNTMTVESLPYRQSARNETLTSLLAKCPAPADLDGFESGRTALMDKRGEGVPIILDRSERLSGRRPEYRLIDDAEVLLTIYAAAEPA